jgi:branched-subunit amino acid transport protein
VKAWSVVAAVGIVTICLKAAGPVLLGRRRLGGAASRVVGLLAPVMLVALVVSQTVGGDRALVFDARLGGVAAAAAALRLRAPLVGAMAVAAGVTVLLRHL